MAKNQLQQFDNIVKMGKEAQHALNDYWLELALYTSLEYWLMVSFLIIPLVYLFFKIDKSQIFFMGFYGYSVHVIFGYIDLYAKNSGFLNYPFPVFPMLPGLSLDSSLVPVTFMLVYQWTLKQKKNYYLYMAITSGFLSFIFKPILAALGLIRLYGNTNYLYLFIGYLIVITIAKLFTDVFLWMEKKYNKE